MVFSPVFCKSLNHVLFESARCQARPADPNAEDTEIADTDCCFKPSTHKYVHHTISLQSLMHFCTYILKYEKFASMCIHMSIHRLKSAYCANQTLSALERHRQSHSPSQWWWMPSCHRHRRRCRCRCRHIWQMLPSRRARDNHMACRLQRHHKQSSVCRPCRSTRRCPALHPLPCPQIPCRHCRVHRRSQMMTNRSRHCPLGQVALMQWDRCCQLPLLQPQARCLPGPMAPLILRTCPHTCPPFPHSTLRRPH